MVDGPVSLLYHCIDCDLLFCYDCVNLMQAESPYAGGVFEVDVTFPAEYPFKAPVVSRFEMYICSCQSVTHDTTTRFYV